MSKLLSKNYICTCTGLYCADFEKKRAELSDFFKTITTNGHSAAFSARCRDRKCPVFNAFYTASQKLLCPYDHKICLSAAQRAFKGVDTETAIKIGEKFDGLFIEGLTCWLHDDNCPRNMPLFTEINDKQR